MLEKVFAQNPSELGPIGGGGLGPLGTLGKYGSGKAALDSVTQTVSNVIGFMTIAAGIWFIFQFLIGGFFWMASGGDKAKLHEARERITNAFIGLLIVIAGWSILALAGQFFGYDILVKDSQGLLNLFKL